MSVETARAVVLDGFGEDALLEARRLCRAGELATCAGTLDGGDAEGFAAVYRAVGRHLESVGTWIEAVRAEILALERSSAG